jgi:hypothetical protein
VGDDGECWADESGGGGWLGNSMLDRGKSLVDLSCRFFLRKDIAFRGFKYAEESKPSIVVPERDKQFGSSN